MNQKTLIYTLAALLAGSVLVNLTGKASAQNSRVIDMTGNDKATWILTDDEQLIYCWWPESPDRRDQQARCRVLDRWKVDRLQ